VLNVCHHISVQEFGVKLKFEEEERKFIEFHEGQISDQNIFIEFHEDVNLIL
jgi:hypothetical protein